MAIIGAKHGNIKSFNLHSIISVLIEKLKAKNSQKQKYVNLHKTQQMMAI